MSEANFREEGFWRQAVDDTSRRPWPTPDPAWADREGFLKRLDEVQRTATVIDFMGHSRCRLCGRPNGASEFSEGGWTWPEGLRHYIADHQVRPSPDFEDFVLSQAG
jgi:hypothetical protein